MGGRRSSSSFTTILPHTTRSQLHDHMTTQLPCPSQDPNASFRCQVELFAADARSKSLIHLHPPGDDFKTTLPPRGTLTHLPNPRLTFCFLISTCCSSLRRRNYRRVSALLLHFHFLSTWSHSSFSRELVGDGGAKRTSWAENWVLPLKFARLCSRLRGSIVFGWYGMSCFEREDTVEVSGKRDKERSEEVIVL